MTCVSRTNNAKGKVMFSVYETWTMYDHRDGICGRKSNWIGSSASYDGALELAFANDARKDDCHPDGYDIEIRDADGKPVHTADVKSVHRPADPSEIPF
jgi:hypothetical protein